MKIKRLTKYIVILILSCAPHFSLAAFKPLDHIIAVVNEDVITATMLENRINDFRKQLDISQLSRIEPDTLKKQVLERMVRDTIQKQQAKQLGIAIDDLTLNRMLEQLAQSNKLSLEDFRAAIEKEGINYTRFREQTRDELIIKQLQQRAVANKVSVSDQEIQQYIEQNESSGSANVTYHLRHILIAVPESATPESIGKAKDKAEQVHQQLLRGDNFEDLAIRESDGRNALKGGDLGTRKANELPQLFVDAVANLSTGESSKPVKSASGFHLLQLINSSNEAIMVTQTNARHILIQSTDETGDKQAREKLLEIKQQLAEGESFADLASEYSEDPGSKTNGGNLGWANPGDFTPVFENVANSLAVGQVSEPFKTQFGWHLLEVLDHREHDKNKTNKNNQARNAIQKRKIDEELRLWLRRIRDEAYVEFIDDEA